MELLPATEYTNYGRDRKCADSDGKDSSQSDDVCAEDDGHLCGRKSHANLCCPGPEYHSRVDLRKVDGDIFYDLIVEATLCGRYEESTADGDGD